MIRLLPFLIILFLSACSSTRSVEVRTQNISSTRVIQHPMIVDLDISETKVQGKAEGSKESLAKLKVFATDDAVRKANADVLVEPKFTVEMKGGKTTVTVDGWPATYTNFRKVQPSDSTVLNLGNSRVIRTSSGTAELEEKKGKGVFWGIGATIIGGLVILLASGY